MDRIIICIPTYISVSAKLFQQWIDVSSWCAQNGIQIITVPNRTHNDARNWLATAGGGFSNSHRLVDKVDWIIWIDSDQAFTQDQLEKLINCKEKFCCGWYIKGETPMVARWDEDKFLQNGHMEFLGKKELETSKEELIEVDYCGFGFTKTHTDLFRDLKYPYFTNKIVTIGEYTENCSEDTSFCLDVNVKPKVITDLRVGHLKEVII